MRLCSTPTPASDHAPTLAELLQPLLEARRVGLGLAQVAFEVCAIPASRRHRDMSLQGSCQSLLGCVGFVEVLNCLLG